jgi:hypothetical protein
MSISIYARYQFQQNFSDVIKVKKSIDCSYETMSKIASLRGHIAYCSKHGILPTDWYSRYMQEINSIDELTRKMIQSLEMDLERLGGSFVQYDSKQAKRI